MKIDERDSKEIRKLILEALADIKEITKINFNIAVEPGTEGNENIVLRLPPQSSEIEKLGSANGSSKQNYIRSGAKIVFKQIYSNGSEVSYRMSHLEGLTETPKTELKDKVPRKKISREYIIQKVINFLEEVVKYEK